jgi:hypothetical protein
MKFESTQIRSSLLDALQVDFIGPSGGLGNHRELLPQAPSRWYLIEFLVPHNADEHQRYESNSHDEANQGCPVDSVDENQTLEFLATKRCMTISVPFKSAK